MLESKNAFKLALERAPIFVAWTEQSLNKSIVGMPLMPYLGGIRMLSSTLTFATVMRPSYSFAISSKTGERVLQGPHHSAQKSTKTGCVELITSASKEASLTTLILSFMHSKKKEINIEFE